MDMDDVAGFLIAFAKMLLVMAGLCAIGIAMGVPAAIWVGNRIGDLLSGLNDERFDEPCPLLGPASAMAVRGDLEGALKAYEALLDQYPKELEIYWRMLEILLGPLRDEIRARSILDLALYHLESDSERTSLFKLEEDLRKKNYLPFGYLLGRDARTPAGKEDLKQPVVLPRFRITPPV